MLVPLWIKALYTLLVAVVTIVYAFKYKSTNFLWFSDIALLTTVLAIWLESSLLASMMAVAVLLPELAWNFDFFSGLVFGWKTLGLSDYMFESRRPMYLRGPLAVPRRFANCASLARISAGLRSAGSGGPDDHRLGRPPDHLSDY